ncbi:hypothetical protein ElyMa_001540000 [Elysia marginata]|uniref:Uncharacterized protein n=1 Tax=Elysia marginata TaxID=1093978 RepID=A0AAV4JB74_9GAST|nr:hypothetical protein ElyMa_001540000 [Elysia marginata]
MRYIIIKKAWDASGDTINPSHAKTNVNFEQKSVVVCEQRESDCLTRAAHSRLTGDTADVGVIQAPVRTRLNLAARKLHETASLDRKTQIPEPKHPKQTQEVDVYRPLEAKIQPPGGDDDDDDDNDDGDDDDDDDDDDSGDFCDDDDNQSIYYK